MFQRARPVEGRWIIGHVYHMYNLPPFYLKLVYANRASLAIKPTEQLNNCSYFGEIYVANRKLNAPLNRTPWQRDHLGARPTRPQHLAGRYDDVFQVLLALLLLRVQTTTLKSSTSFRLCEAAHR